MSKSDTTKVTPLPAPPRPLPGAVVINLSERRRERQNRDIWVNLGPDEPLFRAIPVVSRGHKDRLFSGFFSNDTTLMRSLIHPDDRARFDVLVGTDLEWLPDTDLPTLTSDGKPLMEADTLDEALQGMLVNFGIARQPDTSIIAQRVRDLLKSEDITGDVVTRAVTAAMAVISAEADFLGGDVVEPEPPSTNGASPPPEPSG